MKHMSEMNRNIFLHNTKNLKNKIESCRPNVKIKKGLDEKI